MSGFRSGLVAIVGRPNTGKSTLLNRLVGSHVSITSHRAQTTRFRILGIHTTNTAQVVFVDTPGLHPAEGGTLNRYMNRMATGSLEGVDCIVLVIDVKGWEPGDDYPLELVRGRECPVILAINKIDRIRDRATLLPLIEASSRRMPFAEIVPVSALKGTSVAELDRAIVRHLPEQPPIYPPDQLTDKSERFLAAELVREQIFRGFGQEVPYAAAVIIERFRRERGTLSVAATIVVEKEGQKAILIGRGGEKLKTIGQRARQAMIRLFGGKVHLELWVKVRKGWAESERELKSLGYADEG